MFLHFLLSHLHQRVQAPGGIGGQCVDVCNLYLLQVWAQPPVRANAIDWRAAKVAGWQWVENGPTNYPPQGAIVVWCEDAAVGTGPYGDVAIAIDADAQEMLVYGQNWPEGAGCEFRANTFQGVSGWLMPPRRVV